MAVKRKIVATSTQDQVDAPVASEGAAAKTEPTQPTVARDVAQTMEKTMKTAEDFLAFGQSNMDAFVKSSQIWAAGVQDISKQVAATAQASFDDTMAAFKALSAVKTPKDASRIVAMSFCEPRSWTRVLSS